MTVSTFIPNTQDLAQLDPARRMYIGFMAQYLLICENVIEADRR